jgi:hypothetical protein
MIRADSAQLSFASAKYKMSFGFFLKSPEFSSDSVDFKNGCLILTGLGFHRRINTLVLLN